MVMIKESPYSRFVMDESGTLIKNELYEAWLKGVFQGFGKGWLRGYKRGKEEDKEGQP